MWMSHLNVLHLRPHSWRIIINQHDFIKWNVRTSAATRPEAALIATRNVGDYAAQRLLDLDFSGEQARELLGSATCR